MLEMEKPLVSIILLHYNQPQYIRGAINSILNQTYPNIELIVADDASEYGKFDLADIKNYIHANKKDNLNRVVYCINKNNLGTVKNLNFALQQCRGKYIKFFAADDELYDINVVAKSVEAFENWQDSDVYMLANQCCMMDETMQKELYKFVNPAYGLDFNRFTAKQQYEAFMDSCIFAMGAITIKADVFQKFGMFDEAYTYIEDWSYFLYLTRNGGKFGYYDILALKHRDGGISHYNECEKLPKHVLGFRNDMLLIREREIIPYLNTYPISVQIKQFDEYCSEREKFELIEESESFCKYRLHQKQLRQFLPSVLLRKKVWAFLDKIDANSPKMVKATFYWYVFSVLLNIAIIFNEFNLPIVSFVRIVAYMCFLIGTLCGVYVLLGWGVIYLYKLRLQIKRAL